MTSIYEMKKHNNSKARRLVLSFLAFCVIMSVTGCARESDTSLTEPVIPLQMYEDSYISENQTKQASLSAEASEDNPPANAEDADLEAEASEGENSSVEEETRQTEKAEEWNTDYVVESIQLSDEELKVFERSFNNANMNKHFQQLYSMPLDFNENEENEMVNITCIAGSFDSNMLYSIFYKRSDDDRLYNVVFRDENEKLIFQSNEECSDR